MPSPMVLSLLDQAWSLGFRGSVGFHHYSEPFLDDRNIQLAQEAKQRGMKPYLHTNGDLLKGDAQLCKNVINNYESIVAGLYDYENNTQFEHAKHYWMNRLKRANLQFPTIGLSGSVGANSMGVPRALVPTDTRMALPDLIYANAPCQRPLIRMIIQHNDEVCNCCEDTSGAFKPGNVYQQSLEELWFSAHHIQVVQNLAEGNREKYILCHNCPLPPSTTVQGPKKIVITPRHHTAAKTR